MVKLKFVKDKEQERNFVMHQDDGVPAMFWIEDKGWILGFWENDGRVYDENTGDRYSDDKVLIWAETVEPHELGELD